MQTVSIDESLFSGAISVERQDAHDRMSRRGDGNLFYVDGLDLFDLGEIARYAQDQCHPDAAGIEVMAEHFPDRVAARIPLPPPSPGS